MFSLSFLSLLGCILLGGVALAFVLQIYSSWHNGLYADDQYIPWDLSTLTDLDSDNLHQIYTMHELLLSKGFTHLGDYRYLIHQSAIVKTNTSSIDSRSFLKLYLDPTQCALASISISISKSAITSTSVNHHSVTKYIHLTLESLFADSYEIRATTFLNPIVFAAKEIKHMYCSDFSQLPALISDFQTELALAIPLHPCNTDFLTQGIQTYHNMNLQKSHEDLLQKGILTYDTKRQCYHYTLLTALKLLGKSLHFQFIEQPKLRKTGYSFAPIETSKTSLSKDKKYGYIFAGIIFVLVTIAQVVQSPDIQMGIFFLVVILCVISYILRFILKITKRL